MKKLLEFNSTFANKLGLIKDYPLLLIRLVLAYGFFGPAMTKLKNTQEIFEWFREIGIPFPVINAYLTTYTEFFGFIFLAVGFATRLISIPLIIIMLVAIKTVHLNNGFIAANNGFEIPLYYAIMLFVLFVYGPGKYSLDVYIIKKLSY
ncbi:MAG: DoxX family protein [Flavobacteriaceae bacterium]|nr:DoxX family protein [Flavobacteriaceae bacterium]